MITITKVGSLVKIDGIEGKDNVYESISNFQGARMSADGTQLSLQIGEVNIDYKPLANFTIGGTVPTNAATVQSALATVFPSAAPATALPTEYPATYAAMQASITSDSTTKRDFFVTADETNLINGVAQFTRYYYNGTIALQQPLGTSFNQKAITNIFDKDAIQNNFYIDTNNFNVSAATGWAISDYIPVKPSISYAIDFSVNYGSFAVQFLDSNKVILASPNAGVWFSIGNRPTFITPASCRFIRVTVKQNGQVDRTSAIVINEGTTPISWEAYSQPYQYLSTLNGLQIQAANLTAGAKMNGKTVATTDINTVQITIANSDKIAVFGNSYTNGYAMYKKHYLDVLGMYSDFQFRNYGKSGDDLLEVLARLRSDSLWLGDIAPSNWGITYGIIACRDNNQATYALNVDTYYENTKKLAKAIEAIGGFPIISTEHQIITDALFNSYQRLARDLGIMFMNWGRFAQKCFQTYFSPFFYNQHPSTRTTWMWAMGMKQYLDTLPRPEKGMKLFRVRPSIDTSSLTNLVYETINDRAKIYEELVIGQQGLTQATEQYFDRLQQTGNYALVDYKDEYQTLQNGGSVSVGNKFLAEFTLPYNSNNLTSLNIYYSASNVSAIYIKKTLGLTTYLSSDGTNATYQANYDKPVGEWFQIVPSVAGTLSIPSSLFKQVLNYDKVSILFSGTSMSFTNIYAECQGNKPKIKLKRDFVSLATGTELLTDTLLDNTTSWDSIATIPSVTKAVNPDNAGESESFPSGVTTVKRITTESLTQSLASVSNSFRDKIVQIRVLCRYFPSYIDQSAKWATSAIVRGSYDAADLIVSIQNGSNPAVRATVQPVGLYWMEIVCDAQLEDGVNKVIIQSKDSKPIEIAKVNVINK